MAQAPKLLVFAGSARSGSWNRKLARFAAEAATASGAEVTLLDLADHRLPMYDGDVEAAGGLPPEVEAMKALFAAQDGLLIASPEYNGSLTPLLKNTIDWVSRAGKDAAASLAFRGRVAGLISASPGALGGLRALAHLRQILAGMGMHVVPEQHHIGAASSAFDADGTLTSETHAAAVRRVAEATVTLTRKIRG